MPEIPSIDPCTNLKRDIERQIHNFEQQGVYLKSQFSDTLKDAIDNYSAGTTADDALNAAIAGATVDDVDAGTTAMSRVRSFAGSCLDSIYNEARVFSTGVDGFINDRLNDFLSLAGLVEFDLLTPLRAFTGGLIVANLTGLLSSIDKGLGCLADSELGECTSLVQDFSDRVDAVIDYLGLNSDATFSLETFQSIQGVSLANQVEINLNKLDVHIDNLTAEALDNVTQIIPMLHEESRY